MNPVEPTCKLRPILLEGGLGSLVGFYHPPEPGVAAKGDVLVVPAFAEEMNRCRSMVTLQAQAFAALGMGTLVLDMGGTGDSLGEFDQADWTGWRADLQLGIAWLRQHGNGCNTLWGIRLGALMAAELALEDDQIQQLLLWVPVVAGKPYWTQFLRIRIAAEMGMVGGIKSTDALRQQSARSQVVETSGYLVGPTLALQLDTLEMPDGERLRGRKVAWFEVAAQVDSPLPRANARLADDWRSKGVDVTVSQVVGALFWQVHERAEAPALVEAGAAVARSWTAPPPLSHVKARLTPVAIGYDTAAAEYPVALRCGNSELAAVVHRSTAGARLGVVIVVAGGPQYRVGAHRQFVSLARMFAANGYPVLRFDLRGMGDSSGEHLGYEHSRPDIRAAIDGFMRLEPGLQGVALFGECASASGILFYAAQDLRVEQIALANPWVRTAEVQAEAILKHYYLDRLKSREFWLHVRRGKFDGVAAARSLFSLLMTYWRGRQKMGNDQPGATADNFDHLPLPSRTAEGLRRFRGRVLFLMSGRDLIAREFDDVTQSAPAWQGLLADPRISRKDIADADHTFSKPEVKAEAQKTLLDWMSGLPV